MSMFLLITIAVLMCGAPAGAQSTDSVVARVQDEVITAFEVYEESQRLEGTLRSKLGGKKLEEALAALRNHTAVRIVEQELVYAEFQTLGVELPANLVQQRLDRFVKTQANGNRAKFEALVEERGLTMKEFEEKVYRALAIELLVREKVRRNIDIGPAEVKAYYDEHRAEFARPAEVRFRDIVIRADGKYEGKQEETAAKVLAELAAGKPFAELARIWSEGAFAEYGGEHDWEKTTAYPDALREALAKLVPGTHAKQPLKIGTSLRIVGLAERRGGGAVVLDADLQEKIRETLGRAEEKTRYRAFVNELRKKYFVKVFDRELAAFWDSL